MVLCDTSLLFSRRTYTTDNSFKISRIFQFDLELQNSKAYKQAACSMYRNAFQRRKRRIWNPRDYQSLDIHGCMGYSGINKCDIVLKMVKYTGKVSGRKRGMSTATKYSKWCWGDSILSRVTAGLYIGTGCRNEGQRGVGAIQLVRNSDA